MYNGVDTIDDEFDTTDECSEGDPDTRGGTLVSTVTEAKTSKIVALVDMSPYHNIIYISFIIQIYTKGSKYFWTQTLALISGYCERYLSIFSSASVHKFEKPVLQYMLVMNAVPYRTEPITYPRPRLISSVH